jgi:hypothetical protein
VSRQHFQRRGRGVFACATCGRSTRSTGDSDHLCGECFAIAGLDNEANDCGAEPGSEEHTAILVECERLLASAVEHGGDAKRIRDSNEYVWP